MDSANGFSGKLEKNTTWYYEENPDNISSSEYFSQHGSVCSDSSESYSNISPFEKSVSEIETNTGMEIDPDVMAEAVEMYLHIHKHRQSNLFQNEPQEVQNPLSMSQIDNIQFDQYENNHGIDHGYFFDKGNGANWADPLTFQGVNVWEDTFMYPKPSYSRISPNVFVNRDFEDFASKFYQADDEMIDNRPKDPFNIKRPTGVPRPNYRCKICQVAGDHFIYDCPRNAHVKRFGKTPYQGKKDCCGEYKCPKCKRVWHSVKSGANVSQSCKKCNISCYPEKQYDLMDLKMRAREKIHGPYEIYRHNKFQSVKEYHVLMHVYKTCLAMNLKGPIGNRRMFH